MQNTKFSLMKSLFPSNKKKAMNDIKNSNQLKFILFLTAILLTSISIIIHQWLKITKINIEIKKAEIDIKELNEYITSINDNYNINMGKELSVDLLPSTKKAVKEVSYNSKNHFDSVFDNLFYPYKSVIFRNLDEFEFLRDNLGKVHFEMVYTSAKHDDSAVNFQSRVKYHHVLVIIETELGNRFGGYTSLSFLPQKITLGLEVFDVFKVDNAAFLFNLDKKTVYNVQKNVDALYCDDKFSFSFGHKDLIVYDKFLTNGGSSNYPTNFGDTLDEQLKLTNGERNFKIKALEAFHIEFFKEFPDEQNRLGPRKTAEDIIHEENSKYNFDF